MFRRILVPMTGREPDGTALTLAFAVAKGFGAHVDALFVRLDPRDAVPVMGEGVSGSLVDEIMRVAEAEATRDAAAARRHFDAAQAAAETPLAETAPGPGAVSAFWREKMGRADDLVAREGRLADLLVLPKPYSEPSMITLEAALLGAGRPVLMAPPELPARIGSVVAVAWNGSVEAARAVAGAMPFLARADAVHVLTAETSKTPADEADRLAEYLSWHGVPVQPTRLTMSGGAVGAGLLARVSELGADLLVMGGYGHSRMRELILGGVTRHVLTQAGLPVLLSH